MPEEELLLADAQSPALCGLPGAVHASLTSFCVVDTHYSGSVAFRWVSGALEWLFRMGIHPYEVLQVLQYGKRWPRQGHTPAGTVLTVWGRTHTGRALLVVLWPESGSLDSYITAARQLTADEEAELQRWEATR